MAGNGGVANIIGYIRVSTGNQDPQLQLGVLASVGAARVFSEVASGAASDRPKPWEALDYVNAGDTLAVYRLDRLARSTADAVNILNELSGKGVEFRSLSEAIDTNSPGGRMIFTVMAAVETLEREILIERTKDGLAAARAQGRVGGGPSVITEERRTAAKHMANDGMSVSAIARGLGVGRTTVIKMLNG